MRRAENKPAGSATAFWVPCVNGQTATLDVVGVMRNGALLTQCLTVKLPHLNAIRAIRCNMPQGNFLPTLLKYRANRIVF